MEATKEKGVYFRPLADGKDKTYYITYKDGDKKKWLKIGKYSEGVREKFCTQKRNEIITKMRLGEELPQVAQKAVRKKGISFEEVWEYFYENKGMAENRRKDLIGVWKNHFVGYFDRMVTVEAMQKFRKDKAATLSARSIDLRITEIGSAFNFWNLKHPDKKIDNPVPKLRAQDQVDLTRTEIQARDIKRERYLSLEEVSMLKGALVDAHEDLRLFVAIALSTGARLGSIMSIVKKDIQGRKVQITNHKGGARKYTGFLNDECMELLKDRLPKLKPNECIFTLERRPIQRRLSWILDKLFNQGLDTKDAENRVVVHTLRHTFASRLVENGVPLAQVMRLLDHKDISTTMRYSHLAPDAGLDNVLNMWG